MGEWVSGETWYMGSPCPITIHMFDFIWFLVLSSSMLTLYDDNKLWQETSLPLWNGFFKRIIIYYHLTKLSMSNLQEWELFLFVKIEKEKIRSMWDICLET